MLDEPDNVVTFVPFGAVPCTAGEARARFRAGYSVRLLTQPWPWATFPGTPDDLALILRLSVADDTDRYWAWLNQ